VTIAHPAQTRYAAVPTSEWADMMGDRAHATGPLRDAIDAAIVRYLETRGEEHTVLDPRPVFGLARDPFLFVLPEGFPGPKAVYLDVLDGPRAAREFVEVGHPVTIFPNGYAVFMSNFADEAR
jgi:hypothetical protein